MQSHGKGQVMANNVYKFPGSEGAQEALNAVPESAPLKAPSGPGATKKAFSGPLRFCGLLSRSFGRFYAGCWLST